MKIKAREEEEERNNQMKELREPLLETNRLR